MSEGINVEIPSQIAPIIWKGERKILDEYKASFKCFGLHDICYDGASDNVW